MQSFYVSVDTIHVLWLIFVLFFSINHSKETKQTNWLKKIPIFYDVNPPLGALNLNRWH